MWDGRAKDDGAEWWRPRELLLEHRGENYKGYFTTSRTNFISYRIESDQCLSPRFVILARMRQEAVQRTITRKAAGLFHGRETQHLV